MALSGKALSHGSESELLALQTALETALGKGLIVPGSEPRLEDMLRKVNDGLAIRRKMDARRA